MTDTVEKVFKRAHSAIYVRIFAHGLHISFLYCYARFIFCEEDGDSGLFQQYRLRVDIFLHGPVRNALVPETFTKNFPFSIAATYHRPKNAAISDAVRKKPNRH